MLNVVRWSTSGLQPSLQASLHTATSSRTRLSNDLGRPSKRSPKRARLEVAPREEKSRFPNSRQRDGPPPKPSFSRDSVPHADPNYVQRTNAWDERNPSFRRRSQSDPADERTGRWASEVRGDGHKDPRRTAPYNRGSRQFDNEYRGIPKQKPGPESQFTQHPKHTPADSSPRPSTTPNDKTRNHLPLSDEFYHPPAESQSNSPNAPLPSQFTSPPLMPGLLSCLIDVLGSGATPTPIQSLSLKWLLNTTTDAPSLGTASGWKQFLLASETGSGKSIAYLLPVLQNLKTSEHSSRSITTPPQGPQRALNPRALILAPTHELARQLSGFAKALLHEVKLRVLCASRANVKNTKERDVTARALSLSMKSAESAEGEFEVRKERGTFPVDLVVGTPMKLLEMVRGRGWDRKEGEVDVEEQPEGEQAKLRRGRDKIVGFGKWRSQPEMGLANVEWVVVDEADVLFDPDFQETTRQLLADISAARGVAIPFSANSLLSHKSGTPPSPSPSPASPVQTQPIDYPFNLILTSATIPSALASYLDTHHPRLMRLASPNLHHLPRTLQTEYVSWSGGNKNADIERRIRRVWAEDSSFAGLNIPAHADTDAHAHARLSKVLIFCNKSSKVDELGSYLSERGIKNVALTSTSAARKRGSNHHLDGFMRSSEEAAPTPDVNPKDVPHVLITTSLLSRGLDFAPSIRHVFVVDEPRNMVDFLHRAGRAGRAGERGKVVVFGKMKGRGSAGAKDVRRRVGALVA